MIDVLLIKQQKKRKVGTLDMERRSRRAEEANVFEQTNEEAEEVGAVNDKVL